MVGDGSYLMMNSEIATSVAMRPEARRRGARQSRLRLHQPPAAGDAAARPSTTCSEPDGARRRSTSPRTRGAWAPQAEKVRTIADLEAALERARTSRPHVDRGHRDRPAAALDAAAARGGTCAVPEVSARPEVHGGPRRPTTTARRRQRTGRLAWHVRIGINPISWTNDDLPRRSATTSPSRRASPRRGRPATRAWSSAASSRGEPAELRPILAAARAGSRVRLVQRRACSSATLTEEIDGDAATTSSCSTRWARRPWCSRRRRAASTATARRAALHAAASGRGRVGEVRRGADRGRRAPRRRGVRLAYHHHMGTVVETEAGDRPPHGGSRARRWGCSWTPGTSRTPAATCSQSRAATRAGSSTSTARTSAPAVLAEARRRDPSFLDAVVEGVFTVPGDGSSTTRRSSRSCATRLLGLAGRGGGAGPEEGPPAHLRAHGLRPPEPPARRPPDVGRRGESPRGDTGPPSPAPR